MTRQEEILELKKKLAKLQKREQEERDSLQYEEDKKFLGKHFFKREVDCIKIMKVIAVPNAGYVRVRLLIIYNNSISNNINRISETSSNFYRHNLSSFKEILGKEISESQYNKIRALFDKNFWRKKFIQINEILDE